MSAPDRVVTYEPAGPVLRAFHESNAFVRGIRGPIGSGKSTACTVEVLRRAGLQRPGPDGRRRTRWAVIRNTYGELRTTTVKTWEQWCPTAYGKFAQDPPIVHHIRDETLDCEVLFLALDQEADVRKLMSLELTGAWINEAREVPKGILDALTGRVGRFPPMAEGGASWAGILLDTNPPDTESWWYLAAEVETPEGWAFFSQPAGDGPGAENLPNLPAGYYRRAAAGKDDDWIKVYVRGEYGFVAEGKPVFSSYRDSVHCSPVPLVAVPQLPLLLGQDFGLTPATAICQRLADGRWLVLDELCADDAGIVRFSEALNRFLAERYPNFTYEGWCDPAGTQRAQTDESTALDLLRQHTRLKWRPAPTNDLTSRLEVVRGALGRLVDGKPGIVISPRCATLRKGFAGGYTFRRITRGTGGLGYDEKPTKNQYSHIHDALQAVMLGAGEYDVIARRNERNRAPRPERCDSDYDVFSW